MLPQPPDPVADARLVLRVALETMHNNERMWAASPAPSANKRHFLAHPAPSP